MKKLIFALPVAFFFVFGMFHMPNTADAFIAGKCMSKTPRCIKGYVHLCIGGKLINTQSRCKVPVEKPVVKPVKQVCAKLHSECSSSSTVFQTICGKKLHTLSSSASKKVSYITLVGAKSATLTRCGNNAKKTIKKNTSMCSLPGGCCDMKTRWNDTICKIELK